MGIIRTAKTPNPPAPVRLPISKVTYYPQQPATRPYVCGHCESKAVGFVVAYLSNPQTEWLLCPNCARGSVLADGIKYPASLSIPQVAGLPPEVGAIYDEARRALSAQIYSGCELLCRKILMHVAVDKGAKERLDFEKYVDYLKDNGYITTALEGMADTVRKNGNRTTHRIEPPDKARAELTLKFTDKILRLVYEAEYELKEYQGGGASA